MDFSLILNPNIAYLLLVFGALLGILAVLSPGTGLLEVGAGFLLLMGGVEIVSLQVALNWWAVALVVLGVIPFLLAVRKSGQLVYLAFAILAFMLGSAYLFRGEVWWQPGVDPILALLTSTLTGGFLWLAVRKSIEAWLTPPRQDVNALIGRTGEAKTDIHIEGSVQLAGELWSAQSEQPIPAGAMVKVVGREGLILTVTKL